MKEYLIRVKINDGESGELIEEMQFIYEAEDIESEKEQEELQELIDNERETKRKDQDTYRVISVELRNEFDDDED